MEVDKGASPEDTRATAPDPVEKFFGMLSAQVPLVSWATDPDLKITLATGSGLAAIGLEEGETVGSTLYDFLGTRDVTVPPLAASLRALKGEHVPLEVEWGGHCFRVMIGPRYNDDGQIIGTEGIGVDQTRELDLESQVRMLTSELIDLRRAHREHRTITLPDEEPADLVIVADLEIEPDNYVVRRDGEEISLTPIEFRLLLELAKHANKVLTRPVLLENVWGYDFMGGAAVVNMAIRRLREKVELDPHDPSLIQTVRGVGYRLVG